MGLDGWEATVAQAGVLHGQPGLAAASVSGRLPLHLHVYGHVCAVLRGAAHQVLAMSMNGLTCSALGTDSPAGLNTKLTRSFQGVFVTCAHDTCMDGVSALDMGTCLERGSVVVWRGKTAESCESPVLRRCCRAVLGDHAHLCNAALQF
jgi:hypothetical protein